jgi:hypothetical protein
VLGVAVFVLAALACAGTARAYDWPVKPFDRQHPVRGTFDDPRTRTGRVDQDPTNPQSFHDGVDIQAPDGTPVYAIAGGQVFIVNPYAVAVVSPSWSDSAPLSFGYWHVDPVVFDHQTVAAHQLLGFVRPGAGHVHLSEERFGRYVNPLRLGGLSPYRDRTRPVINSLGLRPCTPFGEIVPTDVSGCVDLVANVSDPPAMRLSGDWANEVQPPFRLSWGGLYSHGWQPLHAREAVEFDHLWQGPLEDVYAPGTRQNLPGRPGTYYFWLARNLDTTLLGNGVHTVWVTAWDIRGNEKTSRLTFTVSNDAPELPR